MRRLAVFATCVALAGPAVAQAPAVELELISDELDAPVFLTTPSGDPRLFVVEQTGRIRIIADGQLQEAPFIDLSGEIPSAGSEQGLLGLAFHPNYAENGRFFVNYTDRNGDTQVVGYTVSADPAVADAGSAQRLLSVDQPYGNHNGGWLGFGPDGFLYLATGDGGGAGDPLNNGQNLGSLLGKILRIDVSSDAFPADPNRDYAIPAGNPGFAAPEIYAYGLRNPFRASFDGDSLLIGDVGQGAIEEIDLLRPADAGGNYGWSFFEGTRPFRAGGPSGTKAPVTEYEHGTGPLQGRTVTGGYVYRGPVLPLRGLYVFGDFISGNIWSIPLAEFSQGTTLSPSRFTRRNGDFAPNLGSINSVVSFGEDRDRNLFIVDYDGEVFMIQSRQ